MLIQRFSHSVCNNKLFWWFYLSEKRPITERESDGGKQSIKFYEHTRWEGTISSSQRN